MGKNQEIRQAVREAGLKLWQIAEKLGIADCNFSRKLRKEFTKEQKQVVFRIIDETKKRGENENG